LADAVDRFLGHSTFTAQVQKAASACAIAIRHISSHRRTEEDISMTRISMLVPFLVLALLVGCTPPVNTVTGSGRLETQEEDISGFEEVDVGHAFQVDIRQGERYRVSVRIDDNLLDDLVLEKQGNTLKIGLSSTRSYRCYTAKAEVTMPTLTGLELSGACQGTVTGFASGEPVQVRVSGASQLRGDIGAGDARIDVSGASQVTLKGSGGDLVIEASGASIADLSDFEVYDADINASGASKVIVDAGGTLDVNASGSSLVTYLGSPRMGRIDLSWKSSVEQR
jgi:hypothetical protein